MDPIWTRQVYMDNNATTPVADEVRKAMARCLNDNYGNPSSLHITGRKARGAVNAAREQVADVLGCQPENVFFTSGGTEANNAAIKGVFQAAGGGHIITSRIEHDSVLGAAQQVEQAGGQVTCIPAGDDGRVRLEDIRQAIREDTILISIMHANNETGAVQPVEQIGKLASEHCIAFHTDAVQTFAKLPTRVDEIGCEFLSLSAHKINGPKGAGALYWRGNTPWRPLIVGGDQEQNRRTGTEGVHQIVGLGAATELNVGRMDRERARQGELRKEMIEGMSKLCPDVQINQAVPEHQLPGTINATFPGGSGLSILAGLDCHHVCVSIGSACTADRFEPSHVLLGMGKDEAYALSTVRISMGTTTTRRDVGYFLWALKHSLRGDPEGLEYLPPEHLTAERIRSDKTFLIDLRMKYERMLSPSLPGARQWASTGFEKRIKEIPRDKEVIMICTTGVFSFRAAYQLANAGHPSVRVVYGGYAAWRGLNPGLLESLVAEDNG